MITGQIRWLASRTRMEEGEEGPFARERKGERKG